MLSSLWPHALACAGSTCHGQVASAIANHNLLIPEIYTSVQVLIVIYPNEFPLNAKRDTEAR